MYPIVWIFPLMVSLTFNLRCITPVLKTMDYRCEDRKKSSEIGATSWHHSIDDDSKITKNALDSPQEPVVHLQTQQKEP